MKLHQIIFIVLISGLLGFQNIKAQIIIKGKITGDIPSEVKYSIPVNGVFYEEFNESVKTDKNGNFKISIYCDKPAFVMLFVPGKTFNTIIVEPGQKYDVAIHIEEKNNSFKVSGLSGKGQKLCNELFALTDVASEAKKFVKDTSIVSIKAKISILKANDLSIFKALLEKKEISRSFFDLIQTDRDCYYFLLTVSIPLSNFYKINPEHLDTYPVAMKQLWDESFSGFPLSDKRLMSSPYWFEYAKNYLTYKEFFHKDFDFKKLKDISTEGLFINTHVINESKKYLSGEMLEYYESVFIIKACEQRLYQKEFITLYDQFKREYPKSGFSKYIEPLINLIVKYNKSIEQPYSEKMKFVDNYENINTLKEAVQSFKGKKVYIDVWATWCGPCKDQFKYVDRLEEFLRSKNIEILYISIDDAQRDKQWKEMIKFYNLKGKHIRTNKSLDTDLRRIFNQNSIITIPWYILIDENGNIIKGHASRPSEINELKKELNEI